MSRRKREAVARAAEANAEKGNLGKKSFNSWQTGMIAAFVLLAVFGTVGAFSEKYKHFFMLKNSTVSSSSGLAPLPITSPTPQLSKEYIYAGSRMLAVEDANASATSPADLAVWRPSNGTWYVMGSSGNLQAAAQWGNGSFNDEPVPGDYDGDGKTDFSVFRQSTGFWYVLRSSDSTLLSYFFGSTGDKVAPADYDGDGRTDPAMWRPSNGFWYIKKSSNGADLSQQFGYAQSDIPAPADYDGDGLGDVAVWRPSNGTFYWLASSNGQLQEVTHGQNGDTPIPGDYDGDGKADCAVRRGADWIIRNSSNSQIQTITWQQGSDKEVRNDYDGDGKLDVAVWRDATGVWYIRNSSTQLLRQVQWGMTGDFPVPAFYRR